jgi:hypothetical protein
MSIVHILFSVFEFAFVVLALYCAYKGCKQDTCIERIENSIRTRVSPTVDPKDNGPSKTVAPPPGIPERETEPPPYVTLVNA